MIHIQDKSIIFEAFDGKSYGCSPRAIYEAILGDIRFIDFQFIWVFQDIERHSFLLQDPRTSIVQYDSKNYYESYAESKYWIVNCMIPLAVTKQPEQIMVQCWHGTPLKRLRTDIIENSVAPDSADNISYKNSLDVSRYDYFISPSHYASEHFNSAFKLKAPDSEVILLEVGYPRNDFLTKSSQSNVARIKIELGIPDNKKVLLYAPTWRDDQQITDKDYSYKLALNLASLQESLSGSYVVLLRLHSYITETLNLDAYTGFIYDVSKVDDINELYVASDILVTDYSSVFFDYANLKRPILFYMYDKDHYEKELRGFYLPVGELPGDIVTTQAALTDRLLNFEEYKARTAGRIAAFHNKFNYLDDGHASERVIDAVWGSDSDNLAVVADDLAHLGNK